MINNPSGTSCVNCGDPSGDFILEYSVGDYICSKCGAVQPEQVIDNGQEWRDFDDETGSSSQSRARAELVDDEFASLGTGISASGFGETLLEARTLSKYAKLVQSESEKSEQSPMLGNTALRHIAGRILGWQFSDANVHRFDEVYSKINELGEVLALPTRIRQTAKELLKQFEKKRDKNMKGVRKEAFLLAILLLAAKHEQGGRTLKGFSRATNIEEKDIKRFYKLLLRDPLLASPTGTMKPIEDEVKELVESFCNRLQQPFHVVKEAKEVASKAIGFLEGKRPSSIAAAAILFIFNIHQTTHKQQDLANVAGISTNTLRNVYKELNKHIDQLPNHLFQIKANVHIAS